MGKSCVSLSRIPAGKGLISLLAVGSHDRSVSLVGIVSNLAIGGVTMQKDKRPRSALADMIRVSLRDGILLHTMLPETDRERRL